MIHSFFFIKHSLYLKGSLNFSFNIEIINKILINNKIDIVNQNIKTPNRFI